MKTFVTLAVIVGLLAAWKSLDVTPQQLQRYGPPVAGAMGLLIYFFLRRRAGQPARKEKRRGAGERDSSSTR